MVPRKGQDTLIRAWPEVLAGSAGHGPAGRPLLLLVGDGPYRPALQRLAARTGVADSVLFSGPVGWDELPSYYDAGNVFAMPCRTRRAGLDVEGLGIVYLEASATGLPVVAGDSGGAPDAVRDGETGYVVAGRGVHEVAARLTDLLADPVGAAAMGKKGRSFIEREWTWDLVARRLQDVLTGAVV
jgi:phosphatidylinositol alpha-1,6-mannosyltransferase